MTYFIFELKWSQTDHSKVIVEAESKEDAQTFANHIWGGEHGARYIDCVGTVKSMHTVSAADIAQIESMKG